MTLRTIHKADMLQQRTSPRLMSVSEPTTRDILDALLSFREAVEVRFDGVDRRFDRLEGRMNGIEGRMDRLEVRMDVLERRVTSLEIKVDEGFEKVDVRLGTLERRRRR